jgi:hypothetical protein
MRVVGMSRIVQLRQPSTEFPMSIDVVAPVDVVRDPEAVDELVYVVAI